MRFSTRSMSKTARLPWLAAALLGACTAGSVGDGTASVECTTGADGELICVQNGGEDQPGTEDNEGGDPGTAEVTCSSESCVVHCEEGGTNEDGSTSEVEHCVIECENGLRCDQVCSGDTCALYCTCPDGGGGGGDDGGCDSDTGENCPPDCEGGTAENCDPPTDDWCAEHPESAECQPPPGDDCQEYPDAEGCQPDPTEDYCAEHPDAPECCTDDGTGGEQPDDAYCQEHPDAEGCA